MTNQHTTLPFATFAIIQTDKDGTVLCQNKKAMRLFSIRKGSGLFRLSTLPQERIEAELAQNGYAMAELSGKCASTALIVLLDDQTLAWLFLEELQQELMRDTLFSRPKALARFRETVADIVGTHRAEPHLEEKRGSLACAMRAAVNAQSGSLLIADAISFTKEVFLPLLARNGVLGKVEWEGECDALPVALADLAMALLHSATVLTQDHNKLHYFFTASADRLSVTVRATGKTDRTAPARKQKRLALDLAFAQELLCTSSCQIGFSFSDETTCTIEWERGLHAIAYLGSNSYALRDQIYQIECVMQNVLSLTSVRKENR